MQMTAAIIEPMTGQSVSAKFPTNPYIAQPQLRKNTRTHAQKNQQCHLQLTRRMNSSNKL